jgi:hypothetical protein
MEYGIKAITSSLSRPHQVPQEFQSTAAKGRGGDDTVAHLDSGEVVIPKNLQSPGLMALFAKNARSKGTDPSRYIVGSKENSVNPNTGLQEFFASPDGQGGGYGEGGNATSGGGTSEGSSGGGGEGGNNSSRSPVRAGPRITGGQAEFDAEQENNPNGVANARAMGWGVDNSDYGVNTPASMFSYSDIAMQQTIDAYDKQFAKDNRLTDQTIAAKALAAPFGVSATPIGLSNSVRMSVNPPKTFGNIAIPGLGYAIDGILGALGIDASIDIGDVSLGPDSPSYGVSDALASASDALAGLGPSVGNTSGEVSRDNGDGPDIRIPGDVSPSILSAQATPDNTNFFDTFIPTGFSSGQLLADGSYLPNYLDFFDVSEDGSVELPPERQYLLDQFIYRNLPSLTA